MAKHDWDALQAAFIQEHCETGIAAKDWCEQQGLNYKSARRYIKTSAAKEVKKKKEAPVIAREPDKPIQRPGSVGNQRARKHGAYSGYFNKNVTELVEETTLHDELELCRMRTHSVIDAMQKIQEQLKECNSVETAASLWESYTRAEQALDRIVARTESLTKTLSSLKIDNIAYDKILAETAQKQQATELIKLNIEKLSKEIGGTSKLDEFIDELTGGKDQVVG